MTMLMHTLKTPESAYLISSMLCFFLFSFVVVVVVVAAAASWSLLYAYRRGIVSICHTDSDKQTKSRDLGSKIIFIRYNDDGFQEFELYNNNKNNIRRRTHTHTHAYTRTHSQERTMGYINIFLAPVSLFLQIVKPFLNYAMAFRNHKFVIFIYIYMFYFLFLQQLYHYKYMYIFFTLLR